MTFGKSFTAIADNTSAFYWNPAGLIATQTLTLSGMYGPQFGNWNNALASYHQAGITFPLKKACLAVNWICLVINDIPVFPVLQGTDFWDRFYNPSLRPTGEHERSISDRENAIYFSFSKQLDFEINLGWMYHKFRVQLPFGASIKSIHQKIGHSSASGIGLDLGMLVKIPMDDFFQKKKLGSLQIGIAAYDVMQTQLSWNTRHSDKLTFTQTMAFSYSYPFHKDHCLLLGSDLKNAWGVEWTGWKKVSLRGSYQSGELFTGAGFSLKQIQVDYLFQSHDLGNSHRVSCEFHFTK